MQLITQLIDRADEVASTLGKFSNDIDERRARALEIVGELEGALQLPGGEELPDGPLRERLEQTVGRFQDFVRHSREEVESFVCGQEFISQFDDSLIVMVYGKVNCGKKQPR